LGHIDADHSSRWPHLIGGHERIETSTRADVDDAFAVREPAKREWIRDAGKRLHRRVRQRPNERVIVTEAVRKIAARVEVELAMRVQRNVAILALDLLSQRSRIDDDVFLRADRHFASPIAVGRYRYSSRSRIVSPPTAGGYFA